MDKIKLEQIITSPNFSFGQLFMWIGANNDQIWLHMGYMSDSEQRSNRLELYLISVLVNFSCLVCWSLTSLCHSNGHIETMPAREINPFTALTRIRSQFLRTQWSTSNHQRVDTTTPQTAEPSGLAVNFSCELGQIMTRYDFLCARWVILSNVWTDLNLT